MNKFIFSLTILFLSITISCDTTKNVKQQEIVQVEITQEEVWAYKGIRNLNEECKVSDFPLAGINTPSDRNIRSMVNGIVAGGRFRDIKNFELFGGRQIIEIEMDYYLNNLKNVSTYYYMVFNFEETGSDGAVIAPGDILGRVTTGNAKAIIFSDNLDPYLVINSNQPPVFYGGYFWFNPMFTSSSGPAKWTEFDPISDLNSELIDIAQHSSDSDPGLTLLNKKIRFQIRLSEYPRSLSDAEVFSINAYERILYPRTGIISHVSEIKAGDYTYLLCWQNGFSSYLAREYKLNEEIWLCGSVVTYDVWNQKGYIFLRDFSLISLEEIYKGRLRELRGDA